MTTRIGPDQIYRNKCRKRAWVEVMKLAARGMFTEAAEHARRHDIGDALLKVATELERERRE